MTQWTGGSDDARGERQKRMSSTRKMGPRLGTQMVRPRHRGQGRACGNGSCVPVEARSAAESDGGGEGDGGLRKESPGEMRGPGDRCVVVRQR